MDSRPTASHTRQLHGLQWSTQNYHWQDQIDAYSRHFTFNNLRNCCYWSYKNLFIWELCPWTKGSSTKQTVYGLFEFITSGRFGGMPETCWYDMRDNKKQVNNHGKICNSYVNCLFEICLHLSMQWTSISSRELIGSLKCASMYLCDRLTSHSGGSKYNPSSGWVGQ